MPPAEREKFKQVAEAKSQGHPMCPEEVQCSDKCTMGLIRSIPYCGFVLFQVGGFGKKQEMANAEAMPPPAPPKPPASVPSKPVEEELVSDDRLEILKKDDDDEDLVMPQSSPKMAKAAKGKRGKQKQKLLLAWQPSSNEILGEDDDDLADTLDSATASTTATSVDLVTTAPNRWQLNSPATHNKGGNLSIPASHRPATLFCLH